MSKEGYLSCIGKSLVVHMKGSLRGAAMAGNEIKDSLRFVEMSF